MQAVKPTLKMRNNFAIMMYTDY